MTANNPKLPNSNDASNASLFAGEANDELTGHEYDGIQEYDNPLPGWWKWLFIITVLFSFPYWAYYHFGGSGRTIPDTYQVASAQVARLLLATMGEIKPDRPTLVRLLNEPDGLAVGRGVFQTNCVSCHGKEGQGMVGPNLTDEFYKNIKDIDDILRIVNNGAAGGAMPPWLNRLDEAERVLVSSYVASLRGKDAAGGKLAEGKVIEPWPTPEQVSEAESKDDDIEKDDAEKDDVEKVDAESQANKGTEGITAG